MHLVEIPSSHFSGHCIFLTACGAGGFASAVGLLLSFLFLSRPGEAGLARFLLDVDSTFFLAASVSFRNLIELRAGVSSFYVFSLELADAGAAAGAALVVMDAAISSSSATLASASCLKFGYTIIKSIISLTAVYCM